MKKYILTTLLLICLLTGCQVKESKQPTANIIQTQINESVSSTYFDTWTTYSINKEVRGTFLHQAIENGEVVEQTGTVKIAEDKMNLCIGINNTDNVLHVYHTVQEDIYLDDEHFFNVNQQYPIISTYFIKTTELKDGDVIALIVFDNVSHETLDLNVQYPYMFKITYQY